MRGAAQEVGFGDGDTASMTLRTFHLWANHSNRVMPNLLQGPALRCGNWASYALLTF